MTPSKSSSGPPEPGEAVGTGDGEGVSDGVAVGTAVGLWEGVGRGAGVALAVGVATAVADGPGDGVAAGGGSAAVTVGCNVAVGTGVDVAVTLGGGAGGVVVGDGVGAGLSDGITTGCGVAVGAGASVAPDGVNTGPSIGTLLRGGVAVACGVTGGGWLTCGSTGVDGPAGASPGSGPRTATGAGCAVEVGIWKGVGTGLLHRLIGVAGAPGVGVRRKISGSGPAQAAAISMTIPKVSTGPLRRTGSLKEIIFCAFLHLQIAAHPSITAQPGSDHQPQLSGARAGGRSLAPCLSAGPMLADAHQGPAAAPPR